MHAPLRIRTHDPRAGASSMIVQLLNPAPYGGLETVATYLTSGLHAMGIRCAVVAVVDEGSQEPRLIGELRQQGVTVEVLRVAPRNYLAERAHIARVLQKLQASVVHSHGYRMDVMMRTIVDRAGPAWVSTLHGFTGGGFKNRVYELLQLRALRTADRVIGVSQTVVERALNSGIPSGHLRLIRNAIPSRTGLSPSAARAELQLTEGQRWVGWVGRLCAEKDPELFVEALRAVSDDTIRGVVVGSGPLEADLRARHADLISSGRLVMAGHRLDAGRLMPAFHALVVSSVTEGTPMVVLEAMLQSVPVVAMSVGGLPDLLGEGAGELVIPRSAYTLGAAVQTLLNDTPRVASVVEAASNRIVSRFSSAEWLKSHMRLYSELSAVSVESAS